MKREKGDAHGPGARGASLRPARGQNPTVHAQNANRDLISSFGAVWWCLRRHNELPDLVPPDLVCLASGQKRQTRSGSLCTVPLHPVTVTSTAQNGCKPFCRAFWLFSYRRTGEFVRARLCWFYGSSLECCLLPQKDQEVQAKQNNGCYNH